MFCTARRQLCSQLAHRSYGSFSPESIFNEENMTKTAAKFAKMKPVRPQSDVPVKKNAAVLVPLCVVNDQVSLLYTLRAPNLKTHRGQVSFPGGMQDAADRSPEETALRETEEELGIKPDKIEIYGRGNVLVSREITGVLPIIGRIKCKNVMREMKINAMEVSEVFTVPLEVLCDPKNIGHTQFRANYSLPVYTGYKNRIWGLTALITHLFLNALLPKRIYSYNVKFVSPLKRGISR